MFQTYADIFARRAGEYQHAMTAFPTARDAEFAAVVGPLADQPTALICDMPSGGGYLARYLAPAQRYLGIDPAEGFFDAIHGPGLERLKAPIEQVPLPDRSVDAIVSLAGLHHEDNLGAVFGEMARLLRPGGRAVIADVQLDTPPARFLNGFVAAHNPQGHDGRFFDGTTRALIEAAGLAVREDRQVAVPWRFRDRAAAGTFGKFLFGLPALDPIAIADALAQEIGFDGAADGALSLRWTLRRFICAAPPSRS